MALSKENILDRYPDYEATIGIEVHVQLKTNTKIFCACLNRFGDEQNTNICEVCAGHPGTLPVLNKRVLDFAIMAGLATNCTINRKSEFSRKHYMYPDLPKNYQITQDDKPICVDGFLCINDKDGNPKKIRITRIHMEEDAGKNIHHPSGKSLVNLNRAGTPLLETVSEPDIANAQEAKTRGGHIIAFAFEEQKELISLAELVFIIPHVNPLLGPLAMTGVMQFFFYHIARVLGRNIDKPRNLAKSVTVE